MAEQICPSPWRAVRRAIRRVTRKTLLLQQRPIANCTRHCYQRKRLGQHHQGASQHTSNRAALPTAARSECAPPPPEVAADGLANPNMHPAYMPACSPRKHSHELLQPAHRHLAAAQAVGLRASAGARQDMSNRASLPAARSECAPPPPEQNKPAESSLGAPCGALGA
jgi:hypothetical protein